MRTESGVLDHLIAMQRTIISVKHTNNHLIFPHIYFAPYRHGWRGQWLRSRPRFRDWRAESQEETFAWCLRSMSQTKEYAPLITSSDRRLINLCSQMYHSSSFFSIALWLRLFAGDSAVKPGNVCSHCQDFKIQCTHNAPRPPKASCILLPAFIHRAVHFIEKGSPRSVWPLPLTHPYTYWRFSSYIHSLKERLSKMENVLQAVNKSTSLIINEMTYPTFLASSR